MTEKRYWRLYFLDMARQVATRSKDPNTQVGCVVTSEDNVVAATGYNGLPMGVNDLTERMERPAKYTWTSHAEENAIALAARVGARLRGGSAYVTHMPCAACARMLIQAGIKSVFVGNGTTSMPAEQFEIATTMFNEAGVTVLREEDMVESTVS